MAIYLSYKISEKILKMLKKHINGYDIGQSWFQIVGNIDLITI